MIIGVIIVSSISVYATYNYFAKDISYRKADGTELNVEQALNELYAKHNMKNTLVASDIYGNTPHNPTATAEYTFEKNGLVVVNLGTRSAGNEAGKTTYSIKIDGKIEYSYSENVWGHLKEWSKNVIAGQKIEVTVNDSASNAAAFVFINFIEQDG